MWCTQITESDFNEGGRFSLGRRHIQTERSFQSEGIGDVSKVSEDILIPYEWIELANRRWEEMEKPKGEIRLGVDVAVWVEIQVFFVQE